MIFTFNCAHTNWLISLSEKGGVKKEGKVFLNMYLACISLCTLFDWSNRAVINKTNLQEKEKSFEFRSFLKNNK